MAIDECSLAMICKCNIYLVMMVGPREHTLPATQTRSHSDKRNASIHLKTRLDDKIMFMSWVKTINLIERY